MGNMGTCEIFKKMNCAILIDSFFYQKDPALALFGSTCRALVFGVREAKADLVFPWLGVWIRQSTSEIERIHNVSVFPYVLFGISQIVRR